MSCADGGHLSHEGEDNIDINAETIDGKNTFHSMARVVLQERSADSPATTRTAIEHKKSKSLAPCQQTESLQCDAFEKPKVRAEPTQREMVIHKINSSKTDMNPVLDIAWCFLRLLHRGVLPVPNRVDITPNQIIPFWTGFNRNKLQATQQLHMRQLLMPNQPSWTSCTRLWEDVRTCMQHSDTAMLLK